MLSRLSQALAHAYTRRIPHNLQHPLYLARTLHLSYSDVRNCAQLKLNVCHAWCGNQCPRQAHGHQQFCNQVIPVSPTLISCSSYHPDENSSEWSTTPNHTKLQHFISWTQIGTSFIVLNVGEFSRSILGSHSHYVSRPPRTPGPHSTLHPNTRSDIEWNSIVIAFTLQVIIYLFNFGITRTASIVELLSTPSTAATISASPVATMRQHIKY